jgi:cell division protein FtsQ
MVINYKRRIRRNRRRRRIMFFLLIVSTALGIVFFAPFFKIARIDINGATSASGLQVQEVCDRLTGLNINWYGTDNISAIFQQFPYIKEVRVTRRFPNVLRVDVTEREPIVFAYAGDWILYLDREGKILEIADTVPQNCVEMRGIVEFPMQTGEFFSAESQQIHKNYVEIFDNILQNNLLSSIIWVDLSNAGDMEFQIEGIAVRIGTVEKLEYKFNMLADIRKQLPEKVQGTLDLSSGSKSYFRETNRT